MSDMNLRQNIMDELDFEPSVDSVHIGVAVANGVVTLSGYGRHLCRKVGGRKGGPARQGRAGDCRGNQGTIPQRKENRRRGNCHAGSQYPALGCGSASGQHPDQGSGTVKSACPARWIGVISVLRRKERSANFPASWAWLIPSLSSLGCSPGTSNARSKALSSAARQSSFSSGINVSGPGWRPCHSGRESSTTGANARRAQRQCGLVGAGCDGGRGSSHDFQILARRGGRRCRSSPQQLSRPEYKYKRRPQTPPAPAAPASIPVLSLQMTTPELISPVRWRQRRSGWWKDRDRGRHAPPRPAWPWRG